MSGQRLGRPATLARLRSIGRRGLAITGGRGAVTVRVSRDAQTALVSIPMPQGSVTAAERTVKALRRVLEPATARGIAGARAQLTGDDAGSLDFSSRLSSATPLVIGFVLVLAFVLLIATFGSPLLALSVIGLNLLSVGAAFGVLVAVFQHAWAQSLLSFQSDGAIVEWLPLFAFVVLFGLSMDYTVLILERAREARRAGASAQEAATEALGATGATVTSAAVVMVAVFAVFATLPLLQFKQLGVGLAAAIALDATIVRAVALPALLTVLGDRGVAPARARLGRAGGLGSSRTCLGSWGPPVTDKRDRTSPLSMVPRAALTPPAALEALLVVIWAITGAGYFWPMWPALGFGMALGFWASVRWALLQPRATSRWFALDAGVAVVLVVACVAIWAMAGGGYFWPIWPFVGLGTLLAVQGALLRPGQRSLELRVDELKRTRSGALHVQASELRRIERDLHDGAQARLVALTMQLGRAEERLADRPETAALVRRAREEATAAIAELRDLARGIAPPVLADRGLEAAVRSRADRSTAAVEVTGGPPPPLAARGRDGRLLRRGRGADQRRQARPAGEGAGDAAAGRHHARRRGGRRRSGRRRSVRRRAHGPQAACRGARRPPGGAQRAPRRDGRVGGVAVRVVIVEDNALLREGLVALLAENGVDVVAQAIDAPGLLRIVAGHRPDLAIVDVRLPPTFSDEGIRAAIEARARQPGLGILILSQYVEPVYTQELLATGEGGIGYLLKERVGEVRAFLDAVQRVATGGTALDREVVAQLMDARHGRTGETALDVLTPREREALELMAEGRTNAAIARAMVITPGAVEKHISNIFGKLNLSATDDDHRRVLAVLAFLRSG